MPATEEFMVGVRKLCDEKSLLMLCDEGAVRHGPDRQVVRLAELPGQAGRVHAREGAGGRYPDGGAGCFTRLVGPLQARQSRVHVRRQPRFQRRRPGRDGCDRGRGSGQDAEDFGKLFLEGLTVFVEKYKQVLGSAARA